MHGLLVTGVLFIWHILVHDNIPIRPSPCVCVCILAYPAIQKLFCLTFPALHWKDQINSCLGSSPSGAGRESSKFHRFTYQINSELSRVKEPHPSWFVPWRISLFGSHSCLAPQHRLIRDCFGCLVVLEGICCLVWGKIQLVLLYRSVLLLSVPTLGIILPTGGGAPLAKIGLWVD